MGVPVYLLVAFGVPSLYWLLRERWIGVEEGMGRTIQGIMPFLPDPAYTERQRRLRFAWDIFATVCWIGLVTAGYVA